MKGNVPDPLFYLYVYTDIDVSGRSHKKLLLAFTSAEWAGDWGGRRTHFAFKVLCVRESVLLFKPLLKEKETEWGRWRHLAYIHTWPDVVIWKAVQA